MLQGFDAIKLSSGRSYTNEGYLIAPAVLAKSGVLRYYARELELTDRSPNAIVNVYRSPEELAKSVASFDNKPLTMDHPPDGVDASTWRELAVGDVHDVSAEQDTMHATIVVRDKAAIDEVNKGRRQLSNGYKFELRRAPAGSKYEFEQHNIQGNHIAIVDRARCGPSCVVGDRDPITERQEHKHMSKVTIDGYSCEVDETAAVAITKLQQQLATAQTTLEAERNKTPKVKIGDKLCDEAEANGEVAKLNTEIKNLRDNALTPEKYREQYQAQQKLISHIHDMLPAMTIGDNVDTVTLCREALPQIETAFPTVKPQLVAALDGATVDKASGEQLARAVRTAHAAVVGDAQRSQSRAKREDMGRGLLHGADAGGSVSALDGRDAWVHRLEHISDYKSADGEEV